MFSDCKTSVRGILTKMLTTGYLIFFFQVIFSHESSTDIFFLSELDIYTSKNMKIKNSDILNISGMDK